MNQECGQVVVAKKGMQNVDGEISCKAFTWKTTPSITLLHQTDQRKNCWNSDQQANNITDRQERHMTFIFS